MDLQPPPYIDVGRAALSDPRHTRIHPRDGTAASYRADGLEVTHERKPALCADFRLPRRQVRTDARWPRMILHIII